ncbi:MAG: hypothetical protein ACYTEQ_30735 [Planctomycetota bacterium]
MKAEDAVGKRFRIAEVNPCPMEDSRVYEGCVGKCTEVAYGVGPPVVLELEHCPECGAKGCTTYWSWRELELVEDAE